MMEFAVPAELHAYLDELDAFIAAEIRPLEEADDNIRFFDHRREHSRTDWDNQGLPRPEWEALLTEAKRRADKAGHWRSEEHTSELQSLMRISYAVFCLKKKKNKNYVTNKN